MGLQILNGQAFDYLISVNLRNLWIIAERPLWQLL